MRLTLIAAALALGASGCAQQASAGPAQTAEKITRAVYADDLDTTIASFDEDTKKSVSRSELGEISDRMHELGDLKFLTERSSDPDSGRYQFDAAFTNGSMVVELRLDPSGKVAAYRVVPQGSPAAAGASPQG